MKKKYFLLSAECGSEFQEEFIQEVVTAFFSGTRYVFEEKHKKNALKIERFEKDPIERHV